MRGTVPAQESDKDIARSFLLLQLTAAGVKPTVKAESLSLRFTRHEASVSFGAGVSRLVGLAKPLRCWPQTENGVVLLNCGMAGNDSDEDHRLAIAHVLSKAIAKVSPEAKPNAFVQIQTDFGAQRLSLESLQRLCAEYDIRNIGFSVENTASESGASDVVAVLIAFAGRPVEYKEPEEY